MKMRSPQLLEASPKKHGLKVLWKKITFPTFARLSNTRSAYFVFPLRQLSDMFSSSWFTLVYHEEKVSTPSKNVKSRVIATPDSETATNCSSNTSSGWTRSSSAAARHNAQNAVSPAIIKGA
jgi:hypothetical protein